MNKEDDDLGVYEEIKRMKMELNKERDEKIHDLDNLKRLEDFQREQYKQYQTPKSIKNLPEIKPKKEVEHIPQKIEKKKEVEYREPRDKKDNSIFKPVLITIIFLTCLIVLVFGFLAYQEKLPSNADTYNTSSSYSCNPQLICSNVTTECNCDPIVECGDMVIGGGYGFNENISNGVVITFLSPTPTNGEDVGNDTSVVINVSTNFDVSKALINWEGTNYSMTGSERSFDYSKSFTAGNHTYKVWVKRDNYFVSEDRYFVSS